MNLLIKLKDTIFQYYHKKYPFSDSSDSESDASIHSEYSENDSTSDYENEEKNDADDFELIFQNYISDDNNDIYDFFEIYNRFNPFFKYNAGYELYEGFLNISDTGEIIDKKMKSIAEGNKEKLILFAQKLYETSLQKSENKWFAIFDVTTKQCVWTHYEYISNRILENQTKLIDMLNYETGCFDDE